jgi:7-keto-8-aminopelargonate synthetase-like enzyme
VNPLALSARLGKKLLLEGKEYLCFNGTSYLGLDSLEVYARIVESNIQNWGTHHGLSRTNNVRLAVYDAFEEFFSSQAGAEAGALFSSGYLAGIAASQYLFPKADQCWAAPDTHPAILPSSVKADSSRSFSEWMHACLERASQLPSQKILILGNAVDPLKAEIHGYEWVVSIAAKHEVTLLIDDSHAFGVLGNGLFGTYSQWKQEGISHARRNRIGHRGFDSRDQIPIHFCWGLPTLTCLDSNFDGCAGTPAGAARKIEGTYFFFLPTN